MPGWREWDGSQDLPVDPDATVLVRFRDGLESRGRRASSLRWEHTGESDDVVAFLMFDEEPADG